MEIQRIRAPSGEEMVVLSAADFDRLVADAGDDADIADARAAIAGMEREGAVPAAVLKSLLDGVHPLVAWRNHRGLSQAALARAAGMTQAAVARLEQSPAGAGRPATRQALARALDAPASLFD